MKSNVMRELPVTELRTGNAEDRPIDRDIALIGHVEVSLTAQIGTLTMSVEQLFGLKTGDVVSMNELLESPVTLLLNGRPVAKGELLAVDDHLGVRILELA